ncbi:hypothetical protein SAMN05421810_101930 [Amycolatopsis arida]|uniref:Uncharacterized protein n=1 Tax=Amycolatopsis arida TaxID=587909 RepID=A0A1I5MHY2_9PSEU|nr:DUF6239 family natural product biosynthesis protein [Amycolatopsis arida]TDX94104.1 hypothetical protein CLV69_104562 [Amycolatopsis arida]SFP09248.1 hypothetical protein SAMN05421810_101930 [Amycolatopsis arida]
MRAAQVIHEHGVDVPVLAGPAVLRVVVLTAVLVAAGFGLLRPFLPLGRGAVRLVTGIAAAGVLGELLLAEGVGFPRQLVVPLLAVLGVPLYVAGHRGDPRFAPAVGLVHRAAPYVVAAAAGGALVAFGGAWLGGGGAVALHTGLVVALVGLSWCALCRPRPGASVVAVGAQGWALACATVGGVAHVAASSLAQVTG